ncbi:MAG: hypothetical protein DRH03_02370 [Deltaproteobacteria bacterium]|nr:MAG: hypothetical protein DRH03_02370 [Deltaproteobacteria bacterium]
MVGRYGGEEFVILLSASDSNQVFEAVQRIRLTASKPPILTGEDRIYFRKVDRLFFYALFFLRCKLWTSPLPYTTKV